MSSKDAIWVINTDHILSARGSGSHFRGICTPGDGRPEDRGALFHAVQMTITEDGEISGRVIQAFDPVPGHARVRFGD